ncbi:hypothetical protein S7711_06265, partial [Stachybotrys chartarum IBT 7711]
IIAYCIGRIIYNLTFHPLAKYPGPKLAAVTDLWWAYMRIWSAPSFPKLQYPAPSPYIYLSQEKNLELFVQVGYDALDTGDGGISGETNPIRHREIAKKLAPAFSTRNLRAKEPSIHRHIDLFIEKTKDAPAGQVELRRWSDWLALDLSADMTYGHELNQMRDSRDSLLLSSTLKLNLFLLMSQISRKFRILTPLMYLTIPPSVWFIMPSLLNLNSSEVKTRIERRGQMEHLDYFEHLIPAEKPVPTDKKQLYHLQNIAGQLLLASWQPLANQFYSFIFFILKEPSTHERLVNEIRRAFINYESINLEAVGKLKFLEACAQESLRLHQDTVDGLPRVSPGAIVDGTYIPKGVICQISYFSASRSPRFFKDPLAFRPQRWLSPEHPDFDEKYRNDNLKASKPFSQGPRGCPGGAIALAVIKLFMAKVLWQFDIEAMPGQESLSFEKHFKFMVFWERPSFWVRFKSVERAGG